MKKNLIVILSLMLLTMNAFSQNDQKNTSNILRFAPITAMDVGVGLGLSYERLLGDDQMVGIIIPFSLILQNKYWDNRASSANYNSYFYFTPGIKIYPFGQRRVTYAVGPSMLVAFGGGKEELYGNGTALYDKKVFRLGVLINNYVNFQITKSFNLGMEAGLGIRYIDKETFSPAYNNNYVYNNGFDITGQFSMTLGYKF